MKNNLKNILVPVDFNEPSLKAVKYAYNLAYKLNAEIILLHVLQTPGLLSDFFMKSEELVELTNKAKDKLQEISSFYDTEKKIKFTNKVEMGKPYDIILKSAREYNVRMIILGENHQGEDANQDLGSTVYHVTLKSPVPVLTLKGDTEILKKNIVVPLDLTGQMRKQLFSSVVYGLNYGSKVHLVSVLIGGIEMKDSRIFKKLKQAKQTLIENGVETTSKLFPRSDEPPFRKVLQYAKEVDAGLILVMTHKEGYTYDNYIGAFAHHIINKSTVPVLSLTSAAVSENFTIFLNSFVDPAGLLIK